MQVLTNYLRNRHIKYDTTEGQTTRVMTEGVAQGFILGPDLWNVLYYSLQRMDMPENA